MFAVIASLVLALFGAVLPGPSGSYISAAADLEANVPRADWRYTRYVSLYAVPEADRPALTTATIYWINSLSPTRAALYRPQVVADGTLLRLDLRKLDWDQDSRRDAIDLAKKLGVTLRAEPDVWEQLARRDVYFKGNRTVQKVIEKTVPGYWYIATNGYRYYAQPRVVKEYADVLVRGWLEPETEARVQRATYSKLPIVRADWFLRETGFHSNGVRAPVDGLYDQFLLQPATVPELEKLLGANRDLIGGRGLAYGGGVTRSGVSGFNRGIEVYPTQNGHTQKDFWRTYDVKTNLKDQSIKQSFVSSNGFSSIRFDGGEGIYDLPNGLHGFVIFNAQEKLIGDVPQEIAFRKFTTSDGPDKPPRAIPDTTVYPWTCVSCHTQGIINFRDEQSGLAVTRKPVGILPLEVDREGNPAVASLDHGRAIRQLQRLGEQYHLSDRLQPTIDADRAAYVAAVRRCNEKDSSANASDFISAFETYQYSSIDLKQAVLEMGVPEDEAREMIHRSGNADALALLAGISCPRDAWERAFEDVMTSKTWSWEAKVGR